MTGGLDRLPALRKNAPVIRSQRYPRLSGALLIAAVVALATGCTLLDEILPGTPFTPDQPLAEVTVVGQINIDPVTLDQEDCPAGSALLWGTAKNTGDLDLVDVFIEIDALNSGGGVMGTYRTNVFNGEIVEATEETVQIVGTSLAVEQSGSFSVCARQSAGSVAGTAYRTDFIVTSELE